MPSFAGSILLWAGLLGPGQVADDALALRVVLEENQEVARTVRFSNHCSAEHRFEVSSTVSEILQVPGLAGPVVVAAGGHYDLDFEVSTARLQGRETRARLVVRCLTCEREPGCGQGDLVLAVDLSLPARVAPWRYRPAEPPPTCSVTRLDGQNLAELFLSRVDQLACLPSGSAGRIVAPADAGYSLFRSLDDSWRFLTPDDEERTISGLDGVSSFSPVERALLGYLGTQRVSPSGPALSRAFTVTVLLRLIDWNRSRRGDSSWLPSADWMSAAVAAVPRALEGGPPPESSKLSGPEVDHLDELVAQLAHDLNLQPPDSRGPYLAGIDRVSLSRGFRKGDLAWGEEQPAEVLLSFAGFQRDALYGEFGYYTTEHASIGRTGHFETVPQKAFPVFGGLIGEVAHRLFQSLSTAAAPESFVVREDGGGRGELARSLLVYLQTRALLEPDSSYRDLWRRLRFHEVEISPRRVSDQSREIRRLEESGVLEPGRFEISLADATRFVSRPALRGLVLSNELLDVMPVEKFYLEDSGRAWLVCPIPYLEAGPLLDEAWGPEGGQVVIEAQSLASRYGLPRAGERAYLRASRFRQYQEWLRRFETRHPAPPPEEVRRRLPRFVEGMLPVDRVPRLQDILQTRYADLFGGLVFRGESESEAYLETAKSVYLGTVDQSLQQGQILLIDYMSVSAIPNNSALLTYGESRSEGRWANPYQRFGLQDITLPPDGRLLAREASRLGWRLEKLAPQETLIELAGAGVDPRVGIGLVAAYARLLALPALSARARPEFDGWLLGKAREAADASELLVVLRSQLPVAYRDALGDDALVRLERIPALSRSGVRWEPENPNFYLLLASKAGPEPGSQAPAAAGPKPAGAGR